MSTAVITPVNPMAAEGKDTVLAVMRRDRENFTRLVSDPKNWNVNTRCTGWETRDLVGHMIDGMEGYFKNAKGLDFTYGLQVDGPWGGKWRVTVKDGKWSAVPEEGDFKGVDALFHYNNAAEAVLSFFQRFPGGSATGDPDVIEAVRHLHFRF